MLPSEELATLDAEYKEKYNEEQNRHARKLEFIRECEEKEEIVLKSDIEIRRLKIAAKIQPLKIYEAEKHRLELIALQKMKAERTKAIEDSNKAKMAEIADGKILKDAVSVPISSDQPSSSSIQPANTSQMELEPQTVKKEAHFTTDVAPNMTQKSSHPQKKVKLHFPPTTTTANSTSLAASSSKSTPAPLPSAPEITIPRSVPSVPNGPSHSDLERAKNHPIGVIHVQGLNRAFRKYRVIHEVMEVREKKYLFLSTPMAPTNGENGSDDERDDQEKHQERVWNSGMTKLLEYRNEIIELTRRIAAIGTESEGTAVMESSSGMVEEMQSSTHMATSNSEQKDAQEQTGTLNPQASKAILSKEPSTSRNDAATKPNPPKGPTASSSIARTSINPEKQAKFAVKIEPGTTASPDPTTSRPSLTTALQSSPPSMASNPASKTVNTVWDMPSFLKPNRKKAAGEASKSSSGGGDKPEDGTQRKQPDPNTAPKNASSMSQQAEVDNDEQVNKITPKTARRRGSGSSTGRGRGRDRVSGRGRGRGRGRSRRREYLTYHPKVDDDTQTTRALSPAGSNSGQKGKGKRRSSADLRRSLSRPGSAASSNGFKPPFIHIPIATYPTTEYYAEKLKARFAPKGYSIKDIVINEEGYFILFADDDKGRDDVRHCNSSFSRVFEGHFWRMEILWGDERDDPEEEEEQEEAEDEDDKSLFIPET